MNLPLPQQTYQSRSKPFSSERLLNLLLEQAGDNGAYMLIGTPGLEFYYDLGIDERALGMKYIRDYLVVATDNYIFILQKKGEKVRQILRKDWKSMGFEKLPGGAYVQMVSNGDMILFLNPEVKKIGKVVLENLNNADTEDGWTVLKLDDQDDKLYTSLAYISGVFLASCEINGVSYVQYTDVLDTKFLYAFQLDTALSNLTALKGNMREVWAFGANSIEVVSPTGEPGNDFFAHVAGAYINKGCVCKNSIATHETSYIFYANDNVVYMSSGYNLVPISTPAILDMIKSWGDLESEDDREKVIGQVFSLAGHTYYMLKFKSLGKTLWYDLTTGSWIERETDKSY